MRRRARDIARTRESRTRGHWTIDGPRQRAARGHDDERPRNSEDGVSALEDDEKKFTFGIRPEDIELVSSHEDADMTVQTDVVEPRGDVTYFSTSSDGTSITVTVEGSAIVDSEDRLVLKFPEPSIYLFDAASGELAFTRKRPESGSVTRIDTDDERTQPSID